MTEQAPTRPHRLIVSVIVLAGFVVFAARKGGQLFHPTIWAEDGHIFWGDNLTDGADLFGVYAGEWWWAQRLLMSALSHLPVAVMPTAIYLTACAVAVLAVSVVLQRRASALFATFGLQVLAFALLVLLPVAWEVHGNFANLHVWLAISVVIILVLPGASRTWTRIAEVAYVFICAGTGFVGVVVAPVALWKMWTGRSSADRGYLWVRSAAALAGALVNLAVVALLSERSSDQPVQRLLTFPAAVVKRVGGGLLMGDRAIIAVWPVGFWSLLVLPALVMVCLIGYLCWVDRTGPSWILMASGLLWALAGVVSPAASPPLWWVYDTGGGWRYFAMPVAMGLVVMVRALGGRARVPAAIGLAACALGILVNSYLPAAQPPIDPAALRAFDMCLDQPDPRCVLPIAPQGWTVDVPAGGIWK